MKGDEAIRHLCKFRNFAIFYHAKKSQKFTSSIVFTNFNIQHIQRQQEQEQEQQEVRLHMLRKYKDEKFF